MPSQNKKPHAEIILHFWNEGVQSPKEIHKITNIPLRTVKYYIKKIKETNSIARKKGSGRPKKISGNTSVAIGQYVRRDPTISSRKLEAKLAEKGFSVSYRTISKHLGSLGYKNNVPLPTPMLTKAHKEKRVEWAYAHLNDNWNTTLFSDETAFQLFRNTITQWYKGLRPIKPIPKNRVKILAWGGFCMQGKTSLFCFRQIMTGPYYVEILQQHLSEIQQMLGHVWHFQQDNDPKHTSRVASAFLRENMPEVIDWPSNSPDLNPIENLWSIVKRNVEKRQPKNLDDLQRFMVEEWDNIPETIIKNLIGSMKRRCEAIIDQGGERINF